MEVTLTITGQGLNFEKGINLSQAGQIMAFIGNQEDLGQAKTPYTSQQKNSQSSLLLGSNNGPAPREFLEEHGAKTYPQMILTLGKYYLEHRAGSDEQEFGSKEIQELLREAKQPPSTNLSRDFGRAAAASWITEGKGKGKYWITQTGEKALQSNFVGAQKRERRGGAKLGDQALRSEILNLAIIPKMEGMPDYWSLKEKKLKILWILGAAHKLNIESLQSAEINHIASKQLRDQPFSNVSVLINSWLKQSMVRYQNGHYFLLQPGTDFISKMVAEPVAA